MRAIFAVHNGRRLQRRVRVEERPGVGHPQGRPRLGTPHVGRDQNSKRKERTGKRKRRGEKGRKCHRLVAHTTRTQHRTNEPDARRHADTQHLDNAHAAKR